MRTTVIYYKQKSALRDYFARLTADTRCMRNTACFYIRVIPVYGKEDEKPSFSGKRVKRGLYQSADGTCLNADVNGSGNILRKQYPDAFAEKKPFLSLENHTVCKYFQPVCTVPDREEAQMPPIRDQLPAAP